MKSRRTGLGHGTAHSGLVPSALTNKLIIDQSDQDSSSGVVKADSES